LYESGIDIAASAVSSESGDISFSLKFLHQTEKETSLSGSLSRDQSSGKLSFSYTFPAPLMINGKTVTKQLVASFDIIFDNFKEISRKKTKKKEDIMAFLHRIIQEILKKLDDKKTNITAIVLDPEDMKEINQISDKKISELISMVIQMVNFTLQARRMANKNKNAKDIIYNPKRLEYEEQEEKESSKFDYSCSLSITDAGEEQSSRGMT
jgi:predicted kinase